ncbi:hypothetical protein [Rubellimicrobium sp. CFH 75288]|uniref:hypothetical protein n=1 Tax=Rubellimicrobium sp. CFH 75288 TaxID=2697034 RepID=UPI001411F702|nr:hypothetical protein [Rubellimicrobium sp. CFH 75288]
MGPNLFLRLALLARNPPRGRRAWVVLGIVLVVLAFGVIDALWGWPDALRPQRLRP